MKTYKIAITLIFLVSSFATSAESVMASSILTSPVKTNLFSTSDGIILKTADIKNVDLINNNSNEANSINFIEMNDGRIIYGEELTRSFFKNKALPFKVNSLSNGGVSGGGG